MIVYVRHFGLALVVGSLATLASAQTPAPVRLKARSFVPSPNVHGRQPGDLGALRRGASSVSERRHLLVQFSGPITARELAALRAAGARPLRYVPDNTVAVSVPAAFDPTVLQRARWVGELEPSDKLSIDSAKELAADFPFYPLTVIEFHPDVARTIVQERLAAAGTAAVASSALPGYMAIIPTDPTAIAALAAEDAVAWIYPGSTDLIAGGALICEGLITPEGVVANYATVGEGWDGSGLGSAALSYYLLAGSTDLGPSLQSGEIARALAEWARFADVRWRPE
ncbi:MAG: hypothetical protein M3Q85_12645, partial [Acidobacteriota bacterium]|nr:hypothetical protein [Acidobacteriota bacterium]